MNGKNPTNLIEEELNSGTLFNLFAKQAEFQKEVTGAVLPRDDIQWASYHIIGLMEEVGEILKADKRWKTHRNTYYNPENKLVEIADSFITLINIALFSGFEGDDVSEAILEKIQENTSKFEQKRKEGYK